MFDEPEDLRILRETIRRAAREKIAPLAASIDEDGVFNREVEGLCWDLGLLTLTLPPEFGGMEKCQGTALCAAVEEIARHCASSALLLIIQAVGSFPIVHGASEEFRHRVLTRIRGRAGSCGLSCYRAGVWFGRRLDKDGCNPRRQRLRHFRNKMFCHKRWCRLSIFRAGAHIRGRRTRRSLLFCCRTGAARRVHRQDGKQARASAALTPPKSYSRK